MAHLAHNQFQQKKVRKEIQEAKVIEVRRDSQEEMD
jgi:hypothetical protein